MNGTVHTLKGAFDFTALVSETHAVDRNGKVICPSHQESRPSCHIYDDHFHCYACGVHGDALAWLEVVHGLTFKEALAELERRVGGFVPMLRERRVKPERRAPSFKTVPAEMLEAHSRQAARLERVPAALRGRGFTLADLVRLGVASYGEDAVIPVADPSGCVLALKRRYAVPNPHRYRYITKGCGTPAWCSPGFLKCAEVLVIEGELNGCAAWLARPEIGVQGIAGSNSQLHLNVLKGRTVYVYADGDEPGQKGRNRWAHQALEAGAVKVYVLEPWKMDACDISGERGQDGLCNALSQSFTCAREFGSPDSFRPKASNQNFLREGQGKPRLGYLVKGFSSGPRLGGKPCL